MRRIFWEEIEFLFPIHVDGQSALCGHEFQRVTSYRGWQFLVIDDLFIFKLGKSSKELLPTMDGNFLLLMIYSYLSYNLTGDSMHVFTFMFITTIQSHYNLTFFS